VKTLSAGLVMLAGLMAGSSLAAQTPPAGEAPRGQEHVVTRGETLWGLAERYWRNPYLWPTLHEANRGTVRDPHWIYPAQRLVIPGMPGAAPGAPATVGVPPEAPVPVPAAVPVAPGQDPRSRFYAGPGADGAQRAQPTLLLEEGAVLLAVQPAEFFAAPWLGEPAALPAAGRLLERVAPGAVGQRFTGWVQPHESVYLSHMPGARAGVDDELVLVRPSRRVGAWGTIIEPVAVIRVTAVDADVLTAQVRRQFGVVRPGDLALPPARFPEGLEGRVALPLEGGPEGAIIEFEVDRAVYGVPDRGFVNLGRAHGLEVGDELLAYVPERPARRGTEVVPPEPVAELKVLRVEENSATVRVTRLQHAALQPGLPVRLIRKMP
jgi:hypothetical protein